MYRSGFFDTRLGLAIWAEVLTVRAGGFRGRWASTAVAPGEAGVSRRVRVGFNSPLWFLQVKRAPTEGSLQTTAGCTEAGPLH